MSLQHPIHEAVLLGICDDKEDTFFEEIPNKDGFFQVLMGFDSTIALTGQNDSTLKQAVFGKLRRAVDSCPFSRPDREAFERLLDGWAERNLSR